MGCTIIATEFALFQLTFVNETFLKFLSEGLRVLDVFNRRGKFIPQTYSFIAYHSPMFYLLETFYGRYLKG